MTINLTRPAPVIPVIPVIPVVPAPAPAPADPRNAMMHAFAVAETVVAQLADRPTTVSLNEVSGRSAYDVELYFHHEPDWVANFAALYGVPVTTNPDYGSGSSTYTSADVTVDGVQVRGWSLMPAGAVAA